MGKQNENYKELLVKLLKTPGKEENNAAGGFVKTGLKDLDASLGGGLPVRGIVTVTGGQAAGKTLFSLHAFLKRTFTAKESGLIISFDETAVRLKNNAKDIKLKFPKHLEIVHYPASLLDVNSIFRDIVEKITKHNIAHVLINSASTPENKDFILSLNDLFTHYGVGAILVVLDTGNFEQYAAISDAVLSVKLDGNKKTIEAVKLRGKTFERTVVPFKITAKGLYQDQTKRGAPVVIEQKVLNIFLNLKDINIAKEILNDFSAKKPGFKIKIIETTSITDKIIIDNLLHGSRECDLTVCDLNNVGRLAAKGALLSLDPYFKESEQFSYYPGLLSNCYHNGRLYGLPSLLNVFCLMYRKDILAQYGERIPETFSELREIFGRIRKKDKKVEHCVLLPNFKRKAIFSLLTYYVQSGGEVSDVDSLNLKPEMLKKALELLCDKTFSLSSMSAESQETLKDFFSGKALFAHTWNTDYHAAMNDPVGEKIGFMKFPSKEKNGRNISFVQGQSFVIPSNTEYPTHASEVLRFLCSLEVEKKIHKMAKYPVLSGRLDTTEYFEKTGERSYFSGMKEILNLGYNFQTKIGDQEIAEAIHEAVLMSAKIGGPDKLILDKLRHRIKLWQRSLFYVKAVEDAKKYIEKRYFNKLKLEDIARSVNLSKYYFEKIFKEHTGATVFDYITTYRIERAKVMLKEDYKSNITQIAQELGFYDVNHFSRVFKKLTGSSPSEIRLSSNIAQ